MQPSDGRSDSDHATQTWRVSTHGSPYENDENSHIDMTNASSSDFHNDVSMDMSENFGMCQGFQIMNPQMHQMYQM